MHKGRVADTCQTTGRRDARNPEATEVAFLVATITIRIGQSLLYRLFGSAQEFAPAAEIAFGLFENLLAASSRSRIVGCAWHLSGLLLKS